MSLWIPTLAMVGLLLAVAPVVVIARRRNVEPDPFFALGLVLSLVGAVLMMSLGAEPAILTAVGVVLLALGAWRMLSVPR